MSSFAILVSCSPNQPMKLFSKNLFRLALLTTGVGLLMPEWVPAQTFTTLYSFTALDTVTPIEGAHAKAGLVLSGNTLYGTAGGGGSSGYGVVFAVDTDGAGFRIIHSFTATSGFSGTNTDGANPVAGLVLSGNTLYGTANSGGSSAKGPVFAVGTDVMGFTNLHSFNGRPAPSS